MKDGNGEATKYGEFIDTISRSKGIKDKQLYERLLVVIQVRPAVYQPVPI